MPPVSLMIAPAKIEQFLAANWPVVSKLLTDHGPWEGFDAKRQAVELRRARAGNAHHFATQVE